MRSVPTKLHGMALNGSPALVERKLVPISSWSVGLAGQQWLVVCIGSMALTIAGAGGVSVRRSRRDRNSQRLFHWW